MTFVSAFHYFSFWNEHHIAIFCAFQMHILDAVEFINSTELLCKFARTVEGNLSFTLVDISGDADDD